MMIPHHWRHFVIRRSKVGAVEQGRLEPSDQPIFAKPSGSKLPGPFTTDSGTNDRPLMYDPSSGKIFEVTREAYDRCIEGRAVSSERVSP